MYTGAPVFSYAVRISNDIVQGRLPWYFYQIWNGSSLTALNKKDAADLETNEIIDCRPICKGEAIKKMITKPYIQFEE